MAASKKFTPRASTNLIENEVADEVKEKEVVEETIVEEDTTTLEPEDSNEVVIPEVSDDTDETKEDTADEDNDSDVTFKAETDKKPIERMVKIRLAKKYDGCIGGEWYHFAKDQVVTVPENVKRILNKTEGMLKPL